MSNRKDFTLIGVGSSVQYGKKGGKFAYDTGRFTASLADGVTYANVRGADPVQAQDFVTKQYADSLASGLDAKESVRVATTANIDLATGLTAGSTIDGVSLVAGDRVLVKDQTTASENGIYVVGTGAAVRATDADDGNELSGGVFTFVEEGTTQADTGWVISSDGIITIGTDDNNWVQFSRAGVMTAGIGMSQVGTVFNVNVGAATIAVDANDDLIVASSATANQVLLSAGTAGNEAAWGALPLGDANSVSGILPQEHGGLGTDISGYSQNSLLTIGTGGSVVELTAGTNGNTLIMSGGAPTWGKLDLADNTNAVVGVLDETNGGTGQDSYATGDILYASGTDTLATLPVGTEGKVLKVSSTGVPEWTDNTPTSGDVLSVKQLVSFNTPSVTNSIVIPTGATIIKTTVAVLTPYTDAGAALTVGITANTNALMTQAMSDLQDPILFSTDNRVVLSADDSVQVITVPGTSTAGEAEVIVQYIQP